MPGFRIGLFLDSSLSGGGAAALTLLFTSGTLDPRITFTRASTGTYYNASGVLSSAAVDTPRFDYDPITLAAKGIRREPARTNKLAYSNSFAAAGWTLGNCTITVAAATSPDGTANASKITSTTSAAGSVSIYRTDATSTGTPSGSIFAKKGTSNWVSLSTASGTWAYFNLNTGEAGNAYKCDGRIEALASGWYRCIIENITGLSSALVVCPCDNQTAQDPFSGTAVFTSGNYIYVYQADSQDGATITTPIPTNGAAATRAADVITMTGTNFSDWFTAASGAFVVRGEGAAQGTQAILSADDNTVNSSIVLYTSGNDPKFKVTNGGVSQADIDAGTVVGNRAFVLGGSFAGNDFKASVDGNAAVVDSSGTLPTVDRLRIGNDQAGNEFSGTIASISFYASVVTLPSLTINALGSATVPFAPTSIFATAGANSLYTRSDVILAPTSWVDQSGKGNNLTASGSPVIRYGVAGKTTLRARYLEVAAYYDMPAISVNRRAHAWWMVCRMRSTKPIEGNGVRPLVEFGPGATDCLVDTDGAGGAVKWRFTGTATQAASYARSDIALIIVSAGTGAVTMRVNGTVSTLSPYTAGTVTGGRIMANSAGGLFSGEIYEYGLIDRELSAGEITSLEAYAQSRYRAWPTAGQFVFDGDSLTEGFQTSAFLNWVSMFDDNTSGAYRLTNQAASGRLLSAIATAASSTVALYNGALAKNTAVLWAGTNDISAGVTAATCLTNAQTWATAMKAAGFKTQVIGIAKRGDAPWTGGMETYRLAYNSGLSGLTGIDSIILPDSISALSNPGDTTYYNVDLVHLSDAGYTAVEAVFRPAILAL